MGVRSSVQLALLAVLCSACWALPVRASSRDELTPYFSSQYFTWSEFNGGRRLLKESGSLFAGGIQAEFLIPRHAQSALALRGKGELFGGVVDYNGETQAPNSVPVRTEVSYLGTRQDLDLGYRYSAESWYLEPFGGAGYRWWLRTLHNTTSTNGAPVSGYTEYWQTAYLRLGTHGLYQVAPGVSLFAEAGGKYPFYTGNSVDFIESGTTTFRPGGKWSGFAEGGVTYRRVKLTLSYEGFRFSTSPLVRVGTRSFFQPESSSDIFGLNVGWSF
jgi:hypothetical protein